MWSQESLLISGTDRLKTPCPGDLRYNPGAADKNCCYQCPSGLSPTQPCPQSPAHCRKQCAPDYYINEYGKCTACVTCLSGLVEKAPCSRNSPRVCECQPGMYCSTPAVNSCARCELQGPEAKGVKFPGTAEKVTIYELPSLGSGPNCSSPDDCKRLTSHATPRATPTLESPTNDTVRSLLPKGVTSLVQEDAMELVKVLESSSSKAREPNPDPGNAETNMTLERPPPGTLPGISTSENSGEPASTTSTLSLFVDSGTTDRMPPTSPLSTGTPFLDPGPMLLWVAMVVLLVGSGSFLLCYWKACRRQIQQKFHLNYLVHTFQPKMEQADSCPTEKLTQLQRSGSVTDLSSGNKVSPVSPVSRPAVETCANIGAACLESLPLLDDSTAGGPFSPREPPEPRVSTEHTNNRIEKIYIMKADTVIVGSVKTEVPEGRAPAGSTESDLEAELEVDHAPHYPEQETEPPLGSCTEVMFSVEEGGKEDHGPTTVSEK
ncbi:tumor necrosis factor receptor superfamily member 8 isoform X2 [Apodemus sylvaticus]|uniref:tumor necrosis factor receptor superfamily member 8 isoform X2 n=1 Tax=Apodemus sylvaticus TaxID=10129 RepID=UPI002243A515|nr:tumor necrosis factor receptor superfamily member 8 isoform X2 [Apodemus sylvaticus]